MKYIPTFTLMIKSIALAALVSTTTYTMQTQVAFKVVNDISPAFLNLVGRGAACGGIIPAIGFIFSQTTNGGPKHNSDFFSATVKGTLLGGLLGSVFYTASAPFVAGRISGFLAHSTANVFTIVTSLTVGVLTTWLTSCR